MPINDCECQRSTRTRPNHVDCVCDKCAQTKQLAFDLSIYCQTMQSASKPIDPARFGPLVSAVLGVRVDLSNHDDRHDY